ncbi:hypothetical protein [Micromonospora sp. NPDC048898]|uniref:hypothetical protein n=1 Tax=Micromonospora sp. NPDC048898 TaxID=3364260 RepID=UPI003724A9B5
MVCQIQFEKEIPAATLRQFLQGSYCIAPAGVYVGRIVHALEPIAGEPDLTVVRPSGGADD